MPPALRRAQRLPLRHRRLACRREHRPFEHGDLDRSRIPPGARALAPQGFDERGEPAGARQHEVREIGVACDAAERQLARASDEQPRPVQRLRLEHGIAQGEVAPVKRRRGPLPQHAHGLRGLLQHLRARPGVRVGEPERFVLGAVAPRAEPEQHAPAADDVERRRRRRQLGGGVQRDVADEREQPDALGRRGDGREREPRVEHRRGRPFDRRERHDVVAHGEVGEPSSLGRARPLTQLGVDVRRVPGRGSVGLRMESEAHAYVAVTEASTGSSWATILAVETK